MYIVSFFKSLFKLSNIGTIIFFLLNAFVVVSLLSPIYTEPEEVFVLVCFYIVCVLFSLSSVGEWFLGLMAGARKMRRADMRNRMLPLITRVHNKALAKSPDMTRIILLKVMYDPTPNAFALGRRTICVTEGLFSLPDEMIEGILAHEMGHLANHHSTIQLAIGGGNILMTFCIMVLKAVLAVTTFIGSLFAFNRDGEVQGCGFFTTIFGLICTLLIAIWTKFCMLFLMWSSRANEYVADKYAMEIGYGYELAAALDSIGTGVPQNSLMKALYSTHPETNDRIGKLQELGVPYSRY